MDACPEESTGDYYLFGWPWPALAYVCTRDDADVLTPEPGSALVLRKPTIDSTRGVLPLIVLGSGFIADTAVLATCVLAVLVASSFIRSRGRRRRGHCPACAYDLLHNFASGCPECGWNRATHTSQP